MIDLMAHYAALGRYAWAARSVDRPAAVMVVPQLAWLAFAATLNASIIVKNPKWLSA